jgi:hypothetical protein
MPPLSKRSKAVHAKARTEKILKTAKPITASKLPPTARRPVLTGIRRMSTWMRTASSKPLTTPGNKHDSQSLKKLLTYTEEQVCTDLCPRGYKAYASKEHVKLLVKRNTGNRILHKGQAQPSQAHAGGDGLQHQAGHGCPHRDDGNGRITPSNVPKTADNSHDFIKTGA